MSKLWRVVDDDGSVRYSFRPSVAWRVTAWFFRAVRHPDGLLSRVREWWFLDGGGWLVVGVLLALGILAPVIGKLVK